MQSWSTPASKRKGNSLLSDPTDRTFLLEQQYRDSSNLDARIQIHLRFSTAPGTLADWFFGLFDVPPHAQILEIGCGKGSLWQEGRTHIRPGWSITLADLSPGMLRDAREHLAGVDHPFEFRVADIQDLPFADRTFDAVIASFMLYHVPDREKAYSQIRRVLKPGGRLYAVTIGADHMLQLDEAVSRIDPSVRLRTPLSFTLESGENDLRPHFRHVQLQMREDALEVTDPKAIVRYAQSGRRRLDEAGADHLRRWAQAEIASNGAVHVDKAVGVFVAWDDERS